MVKKLFVIMFVIFITLFTVTACETPFTPKPTETPIPTQTFTPQPTSTSTPKPTATRPPTATPDYEATKQVEDFSATIQRYYEKGIISKMGGHPFILDPSEKYFLGADYTQYSMAGTGYTPADFVFQTDIKFADKYAWCGLAFRIQENGDHYMFYIMPPEEKVMGFITVAQNIKGNWKKMGRSSVYYQNLLEDRTLRLTLVAEERTFKVVIDDKAFTVNYGLMGKMESGDLAYVYFAGENACKFKNNKLWILK